MIPAPRRAAAVLLRMAARLVPEESRAWGAAMLHELDYIEGDFAALRWAMGGASVLCRQSLSRSRVLLAGAALLLLLGAVAIGGRGSSETRPAHDMAPCQQCSRARSSAMIRSIR